MLTATLKGLLAHKLRLGMTALAVVLGVGFIAGTYVLTDTMNKTFDNLFTDVTAGVDVFVRADNAFQDPEGGEDRKPISAQLLDEITRIEGVASAEGSVAGYAQIVDKKGEAIAPTGPPTLGVSWSDNPESALSIRTGHAPASSDEVVIDAATAETYNFEIGDEVKVLFVGSPRTFDLVGIAGFGSADNLAGATLAAFDLETAQRVLDRKGQFDAIELRAEEGVSATELRARVAEVLPADIVATTSQDVASEQAAAIQSGLGFFSTALLVFGGVAVFVGAFIIFNTFSIVVAQRTREFALLRALGAGRGQVLGSVLIEALIVGAIASAVGLGLGVLIAVGLNTLLEAFGIDLPSTTLQLLPRTVIVSFAVGMIVTVVSSILPARRAARVAPLEAIRESEPGAARFSPARAAVGGTMTAGGLAALSFGLFGNVGQPAAVVGAGAFVVLLGVATLSPLFAVPLARMIGAPIRRLYSMPGKLAQQNAARNPKRTASTAAALMIGLALVGFVGIFGASVKASVNKLVDDSFAADFIVMSSSAAGSTGFSPNVADAIGEQEEVAAVGRIRYGVWRYKDQTKNLQAVNPDGYSKVIDLGEGGEALEGLDDNGVLIQRDTAADLGVKTGDALEMEFAATGPQSFTVEGIYEEGDIAGDFIVTMAAHDANFSQNLDDAVFVETAPGIAPSVAQGAIEDATKEFGSVDVQDQGEFKDAQTTQINQLLGLITALLGLALVIAVLGITNTLALSVFERTREIGLLRAVGMSRRQARRMVRGEAVIIAVIGAGLGLAVGTFFGWALVQALNDEGITELAVPAGQLVAYVAAAAVCGIIAAIPPARRAARLNVLEAIATE